MQEEIENRTVTLIISAVKLTARELKAGMDKYLSEKKSKAMEKARAVPEKPSGKQTVRQLISTTSPVTPIISICRTRTQGTPLISKSISPQGWCRKRMRSTRCSMRAASERTSPPPSCGGFSYRYG